MLKHHVKKMETLGEDYVEAPWKEMETLGLC